MNVKLCVNSPSNLTWDLASQSVVLNPSPVFLKAYYNHHGLNPDVNWMIPDMIIDENDLDNYVDRLLSQQINILGLGIYVWNEKIQFHIAKEVKQKNSNIIVVMGGPQLAVHRTDNIDDNQQDFFKDYPFVDYVVYGDGEKAFQQIIDYESGLLKNKNDFINIIEPDFSSNRKIYPLEILNDHQYLSQSVYRGNESFVKDIIDSVIAKGFPKSNIIWPLEFARGCMYSCSFCDWSQNLTKKVKRRTSDWQEDIDFFVNLDIQIRETDANFGMWKEDIEIFDYCISKYDPKKNFKFIVSNTPKLKKEITEYILTKSFLTYKEDVVNLKFSLQDTNEDVLSAINRPSVPWSRIEQMVNYFRTNLPEKKFAEIGVEIILGLPGQTIDHMIENFIKLYQIGITNINLYDYYYLKNSPGSDLAYRKLWGIDVKWVYDLKNPLHINSFHSNSLDDFYLEVGTSEKFLSLSQSYQTFFRTKHMTEVDILATKLMYFYFKKFLKAEDKKNIIDIKYNETDLRKNLVRLKSLSLNQAEKDLKPHYPLIEKYGYHVMGKWDETTKTFYTDYINHDFLNSTSSR